MPKISALPPNTSAAADDEFPGVDDSTGATKKYSLTVIKEWLQTLVGWISTAMLVDGSVTNDKIDLSGGALSATVLTNESTSSTSFVDLATTTDTVTVDVGSSGCVLLILSYWSGTSTEMHMSYAISGANTLGASDNTAAGTTAANQVGSFSKLITGLTPGSTTFKAKYRTGGASGSFLRRHISVIAI